MKIVINDCFGGFGVSKAVYDYCGIECEDRGYGCFTPKECLGRTDERLIEFIEKFGSEKASDMYSELVVVDIPAGTKYYISNYDGRETIITEDDMRRAYW